MNLFPFHYWQLANEYRNWRSSLTIQVDLTFPHPATDLKLRVAPMPPFSYFAEIQGQTPSLLPHTFLPEESRTEETKSSLQADRRLAGQCCGRLAELSER